MKIGGDRFCSKVRLYFWMVWL